jgi:hypothetical protein
MLFCWFFCCFFKRWSSLKCVNISSEGPLFMPTFSRSCIWRKVGGWGRGGGGHMGVSCLKLQYADEAAYSFTALQTVRTGQMGKTDRRDRQTNGTDRQMRQTDRWDT